MRSLFSGVSGLRVHQTKMDVIGNNVSNVNTIGFKRANVNFCDVFNETLSGASGANDLNGRAGVNPKQIGLGANVSSIQNVMTNGAVQRTDNGNDLMIEGDSFFIVGDSSGFYFTRAGNFDVDEFGNLNLNGLPVCGWTATDVLDETTGLPTGEQKILKDKVKGINLYDGDKSYLSPQMTTSIAFEGNLNAASGDVQKNTISFYDSIGNRYTIDTTLEYDTTAKNWKLNFGSTAMINGDSKNIITVTGLPTNTELEFQDGKLIRPTPPTLDLNLTLENGGQYNSKVADPITIDFSGLTQFEAKPTATTYAKNGYSAGSLSKFSIGEDGTIIGTYTNGLTKTLAQIAVADFKNPAGLEKIGNSLYQATANSGEFDGMGVEVAAGGGKLLSGSLEMSNVDLSYEFTQMIITQRGFQANSRIITTSDDMLQELVNLKR